MDFYNKAASALDQLDQRRGSLKGIVFRLARSSTHFDHKGQRTSPVDSARRISDGKRLLRVVAETLRYRQAIRVILKNTNLLMREKKAFGYRPGQPTTVSRGSNAHPNPESLATILVHDLLFARRGISLAKVHKLRHAVEAHSQLLHAELSRHKMRLGVSENSALAAVATQGEPNDEDEPTESVRWMRVNTIKWAVEEAVDWLIGSGWNETDMDALHQAREGHQLFARDRHLPSVLALSRSVVLSALAPYQDGRLIAQDKASCMPAQLLLGDLSLMQLKKGICVIDATAAPGNKTTMLSALVGRKGKVWAFEKDAERFKTLKQMVAKAGCTNVECILGDFLSVKTNDPRFENVTHILLDPSCSGSGISNRLDHLVDSYRDEARIDSLARFQTTIVSHALRFKSVLQVAYSTCSIWREEDEDVVMRVLEKPEMSKKGWRLKDLSDVLGHGQAWERVGKPRTAGEKPHTDRMVRFDPKLDNTIGFFAAVFVRDLTPPRAHKGQPECSDGSAMIPTSKRPARAKHGRRGDVKRWRGIRPGRLLYL
ncbi:hypothetical protein CROQUDRAFT_42007 [Cronartium quercuum f. sp. fusiforme G11]|uniref:SAM-dependent MTase RsmB/NOP-type domain-containing protein n=1 Tax=Cronartium quercuum f. sp. fusiforme G11 TaxID=708437 RepID=A0A9P6NL52_9BASI|nr:hypothetical protein CROQUDRAFT_42007 [Cronartium quercuum f. sp. fusiforme G11]